MTSCGPCRGISKRTLARWRLWWREAFVRTALWRPEGASIVPAIPRHELPGGLIERFIGDRVQQWLYALVFLSPLSAPQFFLKMIVGDDSGRWRALILEARGQFWGFERLLTALKPALHPKRALLWSQFGQSAITRIAASRPIAPLHRSFLHLGGRYRHRYRPATQQPPEQSPRLCPQPPGGTGSLPQ